MVQKTNSLQDYIDNVGDNGDPETALQAQFEGLSTEDIEALREERMYGIRALLAALKVKKMPHVMTTVLLAALLQGFTQSVQNGVNFHRAWWGITLKGDANNGTDMANGANGIDMVNEFGFTNAVTYLSAALMYVSQGSLSSFWRLHWWLTLV